MTKAKIEELDKAYKAKMDALDDSGDLEECHGEADKYLCELLSQLGFKGTVESFLALDKWYA